MKILKYSFFVILIELVLTGCSVRVHTKFDPRVDFTKYRRYCWLEGCEFTFTGPSYINNQKVKELMEKAVKSEMQKKGFTYDREDPHLLLDVHEAVETDTAYIYHRSNEEAVFMNFAPSQQILLLKGTLLVDMIDKQTGRMIWRSVATSYLEKNPELTEENFANGVAIALKKFPPKKNK